jgi:cell wall-associated NlpC family hydrolase
MFIRSSQKSQYAVVSVIGSAMIAQPRNYIAAVAFALFVAACASTPYENNSGNVPGAAGRSHPVASVGERATTVAMQQLGVPYRYGGQTPSGFDCSRLVHFSYLQAGKSVPRTTRELWQKSSTIRRNDIQQGDLLFFEVEGKMQHVGIYIGDGQFVHAPQSGRKVSTASLDSDFYRQAFLRAARLP